MPNEFRCNLMCCNRIIHALHCCLYWQLHSLQYFYISTCCPKILRMCKIEIIVDDSMNHSCNQRLLRHITWVLVSRAKRPLVRKIHLGKFIILLWLPCRIVICRHSALVLISWSLSSNISVKFINLKSRNSFIRIFELLLDQNIGRSLFSEISRMTEPVHISSSMVFYELVHLRGLECSVALNLLAQRTPVIFMLNMLEE